MARISIVVGYTKWEYWSLTVTKSIKCLQIPQFENNFYKIFMAEHNIDDMIESSRV